VLILLTTEVNIKGKYMKVLKEIGLFKKSKKGIMRNCDLSVETELEDYKKVIRHCLDTAVFCPGHLE